MIVATPASTPAASPLALTDASNGALLAHATMRPVRMLPLASLRVAVNCCVEPSATLALAGETVTVATGAELSTVVPLATFESPPNTVPGPFSGPRNATSWNW